MDISKGGANLVNSSQSPDLTPHKSVLSPSANLAKGYNGSYAGKRSDRGNPAHLRQVQKGITLVMAITGVIGVGESSRGKNRRGKRIGSDYPPIDTTARIGLNLSRRQVMINL
jgi:hypothetical protein